MLRTHARVGLYIWCDNNVDGLGGPLPLLADAPELLCDPIIYGAEPQKSYKSDQAYPVASAFSIFFFISPMQ